MCLPGERTLIKLMIGTVPEITSQQGVFTAFGRPWITFTDYSRLALATDSKVYLVSKLQIYRCAFTRKGWNASSILPQSVWGNIHTKPNHTGNVLCLLNGMSKLILESCNFSCLPSMATYQFIFKRSKKVQFAVFRSYSKCSHFSFKRKKVAGKHHKNIHC